MAGRDLGVLPNQVHRDPRAEAALVLIRLADGVDEPTMQGWLRGLGLAVHVLEGHQGRETPYASAVIAFGPRFFTRYPTYQINNPHGLGSPPPLPPEAERLDADIALHITYTSEARLADLLKTLWRTRPILTSIDIEHGYARSDEREAFGNLDGVRNLTRDQRCATTAINRDNLPEEPGWLTGGCYLAYLKIEQNVDAFSQHDQATQERFMGRRIVDGSRLDLPVGTDPKIESAFTDPSTPTSNSHVRKTGPRGDLHDQTTIFRRGVPYVEEDGGGLRFGLQFVSYQASLDDFDVVLNRWMLNADFPHPGAGRDALVDHGLIAFKRAGFFVVVPLDADHPGAGYFKPPEIPKPTKTARIHIRKKVVDSAGAPTNAEVGGIAFTVHDADGNHLSGPVETNPAGHAVLLNVPMGAAVTVREQTPDRFQPAADQTLTASENNVILVVTNTLKPAANPYG